MITEKYIVTFYGLNTKYYTNEFVAHLWEESANKEYSSSGVFVTSLINVNSLVCGTVRGCNLGETAYIVSTTRNPSEVKDSDVFRESFINVAKEVRKNFGNPFMTMTVQNVDIHYFIEIK
ncbi:hypothetical protein [Robinsoniella peoriensis]|uniref:hypothetical protein n=1 Tax=Robinsoniella peoriensis TaxID=180332 RepID=UPI0037524DE0